MKLHLLNWSITLISIVASAHAVASDTDSLCPVKGKVATPTAFLVDQKGALVKGPVDFGTYENKADFVADYIVKSTHYRMVLFPARLQVKSDQCNLCVSLKKTVPLCPNSTTYDVGIGMVFRGEREWVTPYQVDTELFLEFTDPKLDYDPTVRKDFDARIVGVLVKTK